jgi:hypothetical protein
MCAPLRSGKKRNGQRPAAEPVSPGVKEANSLDADSKPEEEIRDDFLFRRGV